MARAVGVSLPISHKVSVEICSHIKHRSLEKAKTILDNVLKKKQAIPYKRFNQDTPHRPGIAAGRYPQNAAKEILKLIKAVEANANSKGITNDLYITHMNAHKAPPSPRSGRVAGEAKRAHVEIIIEERKVEKKKYVSKKKEVKETKSKVENKPESQSKVQAEAKKETKPLPAKKEQAPKKAENAAIKKEIKKEVPKETKKEQKVAEAVK